MEFPMVHYQYQHAAPPRPPDNLPIKVRLKSNCLECLVKLKKKLQMMSGVNGVDVAPEHGGIVTVSGSIDSKAVMAVIRNNYKKATLLCPFDQNEPSEKTVNKKFSCSDDEDDDSDGHKHDHNFGTNKRDSGDAGLSEPKEEQKRDNGDAGPTEPKKEQKPDSDAGPTEPKEEKATIFMKCGIIMRCFGKRSKPKTPPPTPPLPPPPPPPSSEPQPAPPPTGMPASGFFLGPPRPGMLWMPLPNVTPPPYGYFERPPMPPPPLGYGYPYPRSPPRSNPMVHYTSYRDNYRYP